MAGTSAIGILGYLKFFFYGGMIFLILFSSVYKGIQAKDISVTIIDLGNKFALTTQNLNENSLKLLNSGFSFEKQGIWKAIGELSDLLSSIIITFLWIKLLAFLIGHSPLSNSSQSFTNYSLAFIFFYTLQVIILIANAGMTGNLLGWFGPEKSVSYYIQLPITSFVNFFKLVFTILVPVSERAQSLMDKKL